MSVVHAAAALPYYDHLVNLLVADLDALGRDAPSRAEIERALPGGRNAGHFRRLSLFVGTAEQSRQAGITWYQKFVKAITTNPDLETLFYTSGAGMSVTLKNR